MTKRKPARKPKPKTRAPGGGRKPLPPELRKERVVVYLDAAQRQALLTHGASYQAAIAHLLTTS